MPGAVILSKNECLEAARIGCLRQVEAMFSGKKDSNGMDASDGWRNQIEGAGGELAFAKALGVKWDKTVNTYKIGGDIGELQVRTRTRHHYDLIVRPGNRDSDTFFLVTGTMPNYIIRGCILGIKAKKKDWLKPYGDREPAFFVPQKSLKSIDKYLKGRDGVITNRKEVNLLIKLWSAQS